jgi:hypothetical protein
VRRAVADIRTLANNAMNPHFDAVIEATEETFLNAILAAPTMRSRGASPTPCRATPVGGTGARYGRPAAIRPSRRSPRFAGPLGYRHTAKVDRLPSGHSSESSTATTVGAAPAGRDPRRVALPGDLRAAEIEIARQYDRQQFAAMIGRHDAHTIMLVRVLGDFHQRAATHAKIGDARGARATLEATRDVIVPPEREVELAIAVSEQPVWALIDWLEGRPAAARAGLESAIDAASSLMLHYSHGYLTGKLLHLAANVVRVDVSTGALDQARTGLDALWDVQAGHADRWPYDAEGALEVPLQGLEAVIIRSQLDRLEAHLEGAR